LNTGFCFWSMAFVALTRETIVIWICVFYSGQLFSYGIGEVVLLDNMFGVCSNIITWVLLRGNIYSLTIMWDFEVS
jgi:hypothetical protein